MLLKKRLPVPAYDHLLKLSHTFNIMDARGAVGVTERAECFGTLRALARQITGGLGCKALPSSAVCLIALKACTLRPVLDSLTGQQQGLACAVSGHQVT